MRRRLESKMWWVGVVAGAVVVGLGCSRDGKGGPPPEPEPAATTDTATTAQARTSGPAQAKFQESSFDLEMKSVGEYRTGEEARVEIVLAAKSPYKCNDKYPYKLKLEDTPGVDFPDSVVKKDKATVEKKKVVMTVPFKPASKGEKKIAGRFSFSICTEDKCLIEKRDLALAVNVN